MRPPRSARAARGIHAHLTTDDWAIVSAAVGYACGPDETGSIHAAHPVLATSIACDRDFGRLTGPVTVGYLKSDMVGGQEADLYNQLTNAVNWLESGRPDDYCSSWADFRARRVDAVAR